MNKTVKCTFDIWSTEPVSECMCSGAASNETEAIWAIIEFYQENPQHNSNNSVFGIDELD